MPSSTPTPIAHVARLCSALRRFWDSWVASQEQAAASSLKRHIDPLTGRSERIPGQSWVCY
jgi:hypothetical protein